MFTLIAGIYVGLTLIASACWPWSAAAPSASGRKVF